MKVLNEEITCVQKLADDIYKFSIKSSHIASRARPGQFISARCSCGLEMLLRRPISICRVSSDRESFDIAFMVRGQGTEFLSEKKPGDKIDIIGPLGNGFHIPVDIKRIAVVGGGIGIFPLLFLLDSMGKDVDKHAYLGFRSKDFAVLLDEFSTACSQLFVSSDDGSIGSKAFVTDLLMERIKQEGYDIIYTCGPTAMMKKVVSACTDMGIPCQVSLEQRMGCGIGACLACVCKTRTENKGWNYSRVCCDGPVFWGDRVVFDNLVDN